MDYLCHILIYAVIYILISISLNIIVGYGGMLTMAHAGFFALGCYVYAVITHVMGWEFIPAAVLAFMISAFLSLGISLPAWRFKKDFFILLSLVVQVLLYSVFYNWYNEEALFGSIYNMTNGPFGIANIPQPTVFGWQLKEHGSILFLYMCLGFVLLIITKILLKSPWGNLMIAVRDDELAARSLGKNTRILKIEAFAISCGITAIAGTMYAAYARYIDPSTATIEESILMLSMIVVGGTGNFKGPVVGAIILLLIPEALRLISIPDAIAANVKLMVYGVLLVVLMHFRNQGIAGEYKIE